MFFLHVPRGSPRSSGSTSLPSRCSATTFLCACRVSCEPPGSLGRTLGIEGSCDARRDLGECPPSRVLGLEPLALDSKVDTKAGAACSMTLDPATPKASCCSHASTPDRDLQKPQTNTYARQTPDPQAWLLESDHSDWKRPEKSIFEAPGAWSCLGFLSSAIRRTAFTKRGALGAPRSHPARSRLLDYHWASRGDRKGADSRHLDGLSSNQEF